MLLKRKNRWLTTFLVLGLVAAVPLFFTHSVLEIMGEFLILDRPAKKAEAVVVLNTGVDYYPRLIQAADLYKKGLTKRIVINGNRKTDFLRRLEARGLNPCCPWDEDRLRILELVDVPRDHVISISAENAYDTVSEAKMVGRRLMKLGMKDIILTTSKFHTRRADFIWSRVHGGYFTVCPVAAKADPFDPHGWWKSGRQMKQVLSEYGAWGYYYWKQLTGSN